MRKGTVLATMMVFSLFCLTLRGEVKVWDMGVKSGVEPTKREGWKAAQKGAKLSGGAVLENERLLVAVQSGAQGAVVWTKGGSGEPTRVDLVLTGDDGKGRTVDAMEVISAESDEAVVRVRAGGTEADIALGAGRHFVAVRSVSGFSVERMVELVSLGTWGLPSPGRVFG